MADVCRVLLVEDDPGDARLVRETLADAHGSTFSVRHIDDIEDEDGDDADVVLLDLTLSTTAGLETFRRARARLPGVPIVVLTGLDDAQLAREAVLAGAQDYLVKGRLEPDGLARSIRYAVERHRVVGQLERLVAEKEALLEEQERMNLALRAASRMKDDFIAIASHELRTPVTLINGFLDVLQSTWDDMSEDERLTHLGNAARQGEVLAELVEDLLTASRFEQGVFGSAPKTREVRPTLEAAVEASLANALVDIECDDTTRVHADARLLRRMVVNLLDNAWQHGKPPIVVHAREDGEWTLIEVADDGEGVPDEFVPHLFDTFTQAHETRTRSATGSGLGLAIVARLAKAQGGDVTYRDGETRGAVFTIRLPREARADECSAWPPR